MNGTKLILAVFLAFACYSVLQFVYGSKGLVAMDELKAYRSVLAKHLQDLESSTDQLSRQFQALLTSPEAVKIEARRLGLVEKGDTILRFPQGKTSAFFETKEPLLKYETKSEYLDSFFRTVLIFLLLIFYILVYIFEKLFVSPRSEVRRRSA